ncbi:MAG: hypothetical protein ACF8LL_01835 [Phycisphaerales bacterium]
MVNRSNAHAANARTIAQASDAHAPNPINSPISGATSSASFDVPPTPSKRLPEP